ncbi:uncharacterized protein L3040_004481 [Drepanopeziza brunnea f. sp. 'multigermtubi']|uniref:uncharacterized protein n=1 Tax=Drepanopeziza brunnea f. sp. 'multigermtubi' TaxID=698441 RepID=UPI00239ECE2C|nr:hypothetical protein L3040_004481 [Drepanopeziza brunnea f. sp. 'multigermtubi']
MTESLSSAIPSQVISSFSSILSASSSIAEYASSLSASASSASNSILQSTTEYQSSTASASYSLTSTLSFIETVTTDASGTSITGTATQTVVFSTTVPSVSISESGSASVVSSSEYSTLLPSPSVSSGEFTGISSSLLAIPSSIAISGISSIETRLGSGSATATLPGSGSTTLGASGSLSLSTQASISFSASGPFIGISSSQGQISSLLATPSSIAISGISSIETRLGSGSATATLPGSGSTTLGASGSLSLSTQASISVSAGGPFISISSSQSQISSLLATPSSVAVNGISSIETQLGSRSATTTLPGSGSTTLGASGSLSSSTQASISAPSTTYASTTQNGSASAPSTTQGSGSLSAGSSTRSGSLSQFTESTAVVSELFSSSQVGQGSTISTSSRIVSIETFSSASAEASQISVVSTGSNTNYVAPSSSRSQLISEASSLSEALYSSSLSLLSSMYSRSAFTTSYRDQNSTAVESSAATIIAQSTLLSSGQPSSSQSFSETRVRVTASAEPSSLPYSSGPSYSLASTSGDLFSSRVSAQGTSSQPQTSGSAGVVQSTSGSLEPSLSIPVSETGLPVTQNISSLLGSVTTQQQSTSRLSSAQASLEGVLTSLLSLPTGIISTQPSVSQPFVPSLTQSGVSVGSSLPGLQNSSSVSSSTILRFSSQPSISLPTDVLLSESGSKTSTESSFVVRQSSIPSVLSSLSVQRSSGSESVPATSRIISPSGSQSLSARSESVPATSRIISQFGSQSLSTGSFSRLQSTATSKVASSVGQISLRSISLSQPAFTASGVSISNRASTTSVSRPSLVTNIATSSATSAKFILSFNVAIQNIPPGATATRPGRILPRQSVDQVYLAFGVGGEICITTTCTQATIFEIGDDQRLRANGLTAFATQQEVLTPGPHLFRFGTPTANDIDVTFSYVRGVLTWDNPIFGNARFFSSTTDECGVGVTFDGSSIDGSIEQSFSVVSADNNAVVCNEPSSAVVLGSTSPGPSTLTLAQSNVGGTSTLENIPQSQSLRTTITAETSQPTQSFNLPQVSSRSESDLLLGQSSSLSNGLGQSSLASLSQENPTATQQSTLSSEPTALRDSATLSTAPTSSGGLLSSLSSLFFAQTTTVVQQTSEGTSILASITQVTSQSAFPTSDRTAELPSTASEIISPSSLVTSLASDSDGFPSTALSLTPSQIETTPVLSLALSSSAPEVSVATNTFTDIVSDLTAVPTAISLGSLSLSPSSSVPPLVTSAGSIALSSFGLEVTVATDTAEPTAISLGSLSLSPSSFVPPLVTSAGSIALSSFGLEVTVATDTAEPTAISLGSLSLSPSSSVPPLVTSAGSIALSSFGPEVTVATDTAEPTATSFLESLPLTPSSSLPPFITSASVPPLVTSAGGLALSSLASEVTVATDTAEPTAISLGSLSLSPSSSVPPLVTSAGGLALSSFASEVTVATDTFTDIISDFTVEPTATSFLESLSPVSSSVPLITSAFVPPFITSAGGPALSSFASEVTFATNTFTDIASEFTVEPTAISLESLSLSPSSSVLLVTSASVPPLVTSAGGLALSSFGPEVTVATNTFTTSAAGLALSSFGPEVTVATNTFTTSAAGLALSSLGPEVTVATNTFTDIVSDFTAEPTAIAGDSSSVPRVTVATNTFTTSAGGLVLSSSAPGVTVATNTFTGIVSDFTAEPTASARSSSSALEVTIATDILTDIVSDFTAEPTASARSSSSALEVTIATDILTDIVSDFTAEPTATARDSSSAPGVTVATNTFTGIVSDFTAEPTASSGGLALSSFASKVTIVTDIFTDIVSDFTAEPTATSVVESLSLLPSFSVPPLVTSAGGPPEETSSILEPTEVPSITRVISSTIIGDPSLAVSSPSSGINTGIFTIQPTAIETNTPVPSFVDLATSDISSSSLSISASQDQASSTVLTSDVDPAQTAQPSFTVSEIIGSSSGLPETDTVISVNTNLPGPSASDPLITATSTPVDVSIPVESSAPATAVGSQGVSSTESLNQDQTTEILLPSFTISAVAPPTTGLASDIFTTQVSVQASIETSIPVEFTSSEAPSITAQPTEVPPYPTGTLPIASDPPVESINTKIESDIYTDDPSEETVFPTSTAAPAVSGDIPVETISIKPTPGPSFASVTTTASVSPEIPPATDRYQTTEPSVIVGPSVYNPIPATDLPPYQTAQPPVVVESSVYNPVPATDLPPYQTAEPPIVVEPSVYNPVPATDLPPYPTAEPPIVVEPSVYNPVPATELPPYQTAEPPIVVEPSVYNPVPATDLPPYQTAEPPVVVEPSVYNPLPVYSGVPISEILVSPTKLISRSAPISLRPTITGIPAVPMTTSTVYVTQISTVTSCGQTKVNCSPGQVVTNTVSTYTTVYPVTPTPIQPPGYTTSTVQTEITYTITACPSTVKNCPIGHVTTDTIDVYTTVCPVSPIKSGHPEPPVPANTCENIGVLVTIVVDVTVEVNVLNDKTETKFQTKTFTKDSNSLCNQPTSGQPCYACHITSAGYPLPSSDVTVTRTLVRSCADGAPTPPTSLVFQPCSKCSPTTMSNIVPTVSPPKAPAGPQPEGHESYPVGDNVPTPPQSHGSDKPVGGDVHTPPEDHGSNNPVPNHPEGYGSNKPAGGNVHTPPQGYDSDKPAGDKIPAKPEGPGSNKPAGDNVPAQPDGHGSDKPAGNNVPTQPQGYGSDKPAGDKMPTPPQGHGSDKPAGGNVPAKPEGPGSNKPAGDNVPAQPDGHGSDKPAGDNVPAKPEGPGSNKPAGGNVPTQPQGYGSDKPAGDKMLTPPQGHGSDKPAGGNVPTPPQSHGTDKPAGNNVPAKPEGPGSNKPAGDKMPPPPQGHGSDKPAGSNVPTPPQSHGTDKPAGNNVPAKPEDPGSYPVGDDVPKDKDTSDKHLNEGESHPPAATKPAPASPPSSPLPHVPDHGAFIVDAPSNYTASNYTASNLTVPAGNSMAHKQTYVSGATADTRTNHLVVGLFATVAAMVVMI